MARTRSSKGAAAATTTTTTKSNKAKAAAAAATTSRYTLAAPSANPPKLFVLPEQVSSEARVVALPGPRSARPARYLVCPRTGLIHEFTRVAAPRSSPKSWLIQGGHSAGGEDGRQAQEEDARVTRSADLYVASAIDPVFLVLPALAAQLSSSSSSSSSKSDPPKRMFLSSDDHFDSLPQEGSHMSEILRWQPVRTLLESRMAAVCDTVEAGDESMFRLSEDKLLEEILAKARRMSEAGLPKSMRDKFVTKPLEAPVTSIRSQQAAKPTTTASTESNGAADDSSSVSTPQADAGDSQSSVSTVDTAASSASAASTAATSIAGDAPAEAATTSDVATAMQATPEVVKLQSLRVAFNFICSRYVPPALADALRGKLASRQTSSVDMAPLDEYAAKLAKLKQETLLARSASDFSMKRGRDEDDDDRAEKRRKKDEEDKRKKASESRGVRDLKKVNVAGMKKMSDFFKKKA